MRILRSVFVTVLMSFVAHAQTNSDLLDSVDSLDRQVNANIRSLFTLNNQDSTPTLQQCDSIHNDVDQSFDKATALYNQASTGLTYDTDRQFVRLDIATRITGIRGALVLLQKGIIKMCFSKSEDAEEIADLYFRLADVQVQLAEVNTERSRK